MIWHNVIHTEMTEKCLGRTENTSQGTEIREDPAEHLRTQACRKQGGHKGPNSPKRFTNLLSGSMSSILN